MCGIVSIFNIQEQTPELRQQALRMSQKIRHRGPDWSGIYCGGSAILAHERLSIVDPESGRQPLFSPDKKQVLAVNGEIYNHQDIRSRFAGHYQYQTGSDCEVILSLYREMRADTDFATLIFQGEDAVHARICQMLEELNGIFAFALYDAEHDEFLIARDPIGVIPLYIGYDNDGKVMVASELKALEGQCDHYEPFLPGHYYYSKTPGMKRYYTRDWFEYASMQKKYNIDDSKKAAEQLAEAAPQEQAAVEQIHDALEASVKRQLMSDVPYGVLLSGGLDSSVISAVAEKFSAIRVENGGETQAYWPRLHSFAVGLKGAPDLAKARLVAEHIGTVHHEINYTIQEGLDAIRDVIYFIETYDVTTVRASTPMYLLARVIRSMGIKMVLSGEGADEVFGGYLYFHKAPESQQESGSLGHRGPCALPRQGVPRRGHGHEPRAEDVSRQDHREESSTRGLCRLVARRGGMATERAVLRWCGLFVDRHPETDHRLGSKRRADGSCRRTIPHQPSTEQGGILLSFYLRRAFPQRQRCPQRAQRAQCGLLYSRSSGMGRLIQEPERPQRTSCSRSARTGV